MTSRSVDFEVVDSALLVDFDLLVVDSDRQGDSVQQGEVEVAMAVAEADPHLVAEVAAVVGGYTSTLWEGSASVHICCTVASSFPFWQVQVDYLLLLQQPLSLVYL